MKLTKYEMERKKILERKIYTQGLTVEEGYEYLDLIEKLGN